MYCTD